MSIQGKKITLWRDLTKFDARKTNVAALKHPAAVRKCVFSKDCKYLATYSEDGVLHVFMVSAENFTTKCPVHWHRVLFEKGDNLNCQIVTKEGF